MQEVGPSIFFSLLVITISFLPVFTLEATEGRLFKPLAFTKTYSIGFSAILAVTLTPALAVLLIRGKVHDESKNPINRWLTAAYAPVVRFVVDQRWKVLVLALLAIVLTVPAVSRLKNEFMPPLNEACCSTCPRRPRACRKTNPRSCFRPWIASSRNFPKWSACSASKAAARPRLTPRRSAWRSHGRAQAAHGMAKGADLGRARSRDGREAALSGHADVWWMPIQTRTDARDRCAQPTRHRGVW